MKEEDDYLMLHKRESVHRWMSHKQKISDYHGVYAPDESWKDETETFDMTFKELRTKPIKTFTSFIEDTVMQESSKNVLKTQ